MYTHLLLPLLFCLNTSVPITTDCKPVSPMKSIPMAVAYTGGCNWGEASGDGVAEWSVKGQTVIRYEGHFANGLLDGQGTASIFGVTVEGTWENGFLAKGTARYSKRPVFLRTPGGTDTRPSPDKFIPVDKEATIDLAAMQKRVAYPGTMRRRNENGRITVKLLIGRDGIIEAVLIAECNHPAYILPVIEAALHTHCTPAYRQGQPVECWLTVPATFALR